MATATYFPFVILMVLFSGFFIRIESVPDYLSWIHDFSWFKYGNEALSVNQWHGLTFHNETCTFLADYLSDMPRFDISKEDGDGMFSLVEQIFPKFQEAIRDPARLCRGDTILEMFNFNPVSIFSVSLQFRALCYL